MRRKQMRPWYYTKIRNEDARDQIMEGIFFIAISEKHMIYSTINE